MNVYFPDSALKALNARLDFVKGKGSQNLALDVARAIEEGNRHDRVNGLDRYGARVAHLRSKRKGEYKGKTGPPLAPSGAASRVVAAFKAQARKVGGNWRIVAGWAGVVSKKAVPFLPFHDRGAGRLPRRAIFGISPKTWHRINGLTDAFRRRAARGRP